MRRFYVLVLTLVMLLLFVSPWSASALVIAPGDGSLNSLAPGNDPGFANVASLGTLSGVYLGDRWLVTAAHVGMQPATLNGTIYQPEAGSAITFAGSGSVGDADLLLFRLEEDPLLPALSVADSSPGLLADVVMIGNGRGRGAPVTQGATTLGYSYGANDLRWGTNSITGYAQVDLAGRSSTAFYFGFDDGAPTAYEAQAAPGDSGGAVFVSGTNGWELAGIMIAVGSQQSGAALFGDTSFAVDLSAFAGEIETVTGLSTVPEPTTGSLLLIGLVGLAARRKGSAATV